jgi:hypothetical protein
MSLAIKLYMHGGVLYCNNYLKVGIIVIVKAIFVHDPVSLLAMRSTTCVEHKGFPHPNPFGNIAEVDGFVPPRCLPKPSCRCSICSSSSWIFLVLVAEEIPLVLRPRSNSTFLCMHACI